LDLQKLAAYQISNDTGEVNRKNEGHIQHGIETTNQNPNSPTTALKKHSIENEE
jgi:hypothetical protein